MLSPLTFDSPMQLQLGEGILLANVDLTELLAAEQPIQAIADAVENPVHCLGATAAGCIFRCETKLVHTEARGQRVPMDGTLIAGEVRATLAGTLLAITPENAARLLGTPIPASGTHREVEMGTGQVMAAVMEQLCWIGTLGKGVLAIELTKPVSIGGLTLKSGFRNAGEMSFAFLAQQKDAADAMLPLRMHWLTEAVE